jgi:hypothetical protein
MTTAWCVIVMSAIPAQAQLQFLGLPPEDYKEDAKILQAREQQLRAEITASGTKPTEQSQQKWPGPARTMHRMGEMGGLAPGRRSAYTNAIGRAW